MDMLYLPAVMRFFKVNTPPFGHPSKRGEWYFVIARHEAICID
jgi:hypothetical protein